MDIEKLANELRSHRKRYYDGNPIIPDSKFDAMEEQLRSLDPQNVYFTEVGSEIVRGEKIAHAIPMLSANKVNTFDEMKKWVSLSGLTGQTELIGEPKIDSISLTLDYSKEGILNYAATRGDGHIGAKLSFVNEIASIKKKVKWPYGVPFQVRGEIFIPKKYKDQFEGDSLRNICFGLLNRVKKSSELQYVHFIAYDLVMKQKSLEIFRNVTDILEYLSTQFPLTVPYRSVTIDGPDKLEDFYSLYLKKLRDEWMYETDGLVFVVNDRSLHERLDSAKVVSHHHHYNIAFKPPAEVGDAPVVGITWETSRHGSVIPVGVVEPTKVGPVTVENMTLNNAQMVRTLQLRVGDIVQFERANDVIPKFISVLQRGNGALLEVPRSCPSCQSTLKTEGVHVRCLNKMCSGRVTKHLRHWVKQNKIKDVGKETIDALFRSEAVRSIIDLYTVNLADVLSILPGFSATGKKIPKIIAEIERSRVMTEREMLARFGIPGCGEKVLEMLNVRTLEDLAALQFLPHHDMEITESIGRWIKNRDNYTYLLNLRNVLKIQKPGEKVKIEVPSRGTVCITGAFEIPRAELTAVLESEGFTVVSSVTKATNILLAAPGESNSSKYERATELGTRIVSDLKELLSG